MQIQVKFQFDTFVKVKLQAQVNVRVSVMNLSQIVLMFFKLDIVFFCPSDSKTKMPRLHFSQPQRSFLATEFHRRRGTRDYKMNHMYLPRKMMVDFSLSAVIFATSNFH